MSKFNCTKCGLCCQNLGQIDIYSHLHNGDGVCYYFDLETNLCSIYSTRPFICNVDLCFERFFVGSISKEQYYSINYEGCKNLWATKQAHQRAIKKKSIEKN